MQDDQRSPDKKIAAIDSAIARMMSARRGIVDVRIDRKDEDEILKLTSDILDRLEAHAALLIDAEIDETKTEN